MKFKDVRRFIPGVIILCAVFLFFFLDPIIDFQTNYFDTPQQAIAHSSGNNGSEIVQVLHINTDYGFAFCINDKDALLIKNINSWTVFGRKKFGCQDGGLIESYKTKENELGITGSLNYRNIDTFFFHSYVHITRGDKLLVVGGLTRLPKIDTLLIDGQKPFLVPVVIAGEKYTVWYIKDSNTDIIVNYDGKYLSTI